ncbi:hypothetical protein QR680_013390 [Steinernema hermaphroditum]|uniref:Phosphorylase b kinase regulatory subunit n=1 Tax=Steinernema hermaphroditum TaxID=289476 RepID=A0AA39I858_9BILA|nr:hypothetical protein QR680_013390 [Steinernema hermaphroditum]
MRARSHSGVRLDQLSMLVERTILSLQNPITGLFANNNQDFPGHAWVRDNLYAAQALWAMYRAYQKSADFDEDVAKANELALTCVKIMQSLLECFMLQADKVEQFKLHQRPGDALHAKYSVRTKGPVCGDENWGHLQIDATSLFLLTLAQMTASGLQIVRNFDEVAFVQNLVYYIETGYRTPDYGIWERGDKTNQGIRELNASSIGMVKAALQALNDVGDLFGDGSKGSVIHVLPDQIQQCSAVLSGMLPRESFSKETDAGLLSIISYPAFAVEDPELVRLTRETVMETLLGRYGCRRFLRDGYKTPVEDPNRLYYRNDELQQFEGIECEWPLFLCYFTLDAMFSKNTEMTTLFWNQLDKCVIEDSNNRKHSFIRLVPELYKVPSDLVFKERNDRGTQQREPAGTAPFLWAQSLYIICSLIHDGFLSPAELDPLSRRLSVYEKRPPCEVQVVILADNADVQKELAMNDIAVQRVDEIDPVFCIQPAYVFSKILSKLGESKKLRLSGRPTDRDVGLLSTSKLYQLGQKFIVFTPQFMDRRRSHLMYDIRILMDEWSSELQYIYSSWNSTSISGRPLVVLVISKNMLQSDSALASPGIMNRHMKATVVGTIKKISNGYLGGARVVMKNISEFFRTTAVSTLEFHNTSVEQFLELSKPSGESKGLLDETVSVASSPAIRPSKENPLKRVDSIKDRRPRQFNLVHKTSMRHRSIVLDSNDADLVRLRLAYASPKVPPTPTSMSPLIEKPFPSLAAETPLLHTTWSSSSLTSESSGKLDMNQMGEMDAEELVDMLKETNILDEQASIIHYLWMKFGPSHDTQLNGRDNITVRMLMNEVYTKACDSRDWALVRLTAGLLKRYLDELPMSVNHLLVRQKQLTVGMPSKNEEAITCPKTREEMRLIMERAYGDDPNSFTLAQEIMVSLGSLVRTEPKLFVEMFRLRIGLIIQVLASELARLRNLNAEKASQALLTVSPFELKSMLVALLNGRLLEEIDFGLSERGGKELRTGMGSFRKQIEERKSLRKSMHGQKLDTESVMELSSSDSDDSSEDFQFGIWLRHRRIDGALNRVPADFYASVWDSVRMFPQGISINHINLHWGVTQEMTRREIKFALQVEQVLNQVAEPEYREMIVEALTLIGQLEKILKCPPVVRCDRSFEVDSVVVRANRLFVEHNVDSLISSLITPCVFQAKMDTIVMECCGDGNPCDGAQGMCKHFYDSAPAGEFGTAHYMIRALMDIFGPRDGCK